VLEDRVHVFEHPEKDKEKADKYKWHMEDLWD
jgi:hypothetical protein